MSLIIIIIERMSKQVILNVHVCEVKGMEHNNNKVSIKLKALLNWVDVINVDTV